MVGINPVTTYNPALPQQMAIAQPQLQQQASASMMGGAGMTDLQKELAGANSLAIEGNTQAVPAVWAIAQATEKTNALQKENSQLKQQTYAMQAQQQAAAIKGQGMQGVVQGQALQQLQATMPTASPTTSLEAQKSNAIASGNLGEFAKLGASEATAGVGDLLARIDTEKSKTAFRNGLMAQGIPKDQATALAAQQFGGQAPAAAVAPTATVPQPQQPVAVQQPMMQQAPVVQQQAIQQVAVQPQPAPSTEEMVNIAGVGLVSKSTLTALLQNTSPEAQAAQAKAQEQVQQQQAQQQTAQTAPEATAAPRSVLPQEGVLQPPMTGLPPVAQPSAFGSVSSYGNSGITATNYQQMLAYMNQQQQQPATASTSTQPTATSGTEVDPFAQAKLEAVKLGLDPSSMPSNREEFEAQQAANRQKRSKARQARLNKPLKLYLPKPENKYDFYGGGDAPESTATA